MTLRLRYLDWSAGTELFEGIASAMLRDVYDDNRGHGFLVEQRTHERVRGRFVRRRKVVDTVTTPDGESQIFERVEFGYVEFELRPGRAGIALFNPPRGVTEFEMRLSSLGAHSLTIAPVTLGLSGFRADLESALGCATIRSVRFSDVRLGDESTAQVVVRSSKAALEAAERLVAPRSYRLDRLDLAFQVDGKAFRMAVTGGGAVSVGASPSPTTTDAIWSAVLKNVVRNA